MANEDERNRLVGHLQEVAPIGHDLNSPNVRQNQYFARGLAVEGRA